MVLANLGRVPEAVDDGRRALAMARELGYPFGQALAMNSLVIAAWYAGDLDGAVAAGPAGRADPGTSPARSPGYAATC